MDALEGDITGTVVGGCDDLRAIYGFISGWKD